MQGIGSISYGRRQKLQCKGCVWRWVKMGVKVSDLEHRVVFFTVVWGRRRGFKIYRYYSCDKGT